MPRMIFDLTDEDRALVEAHRIRLGLRSHAETLRRLIRGDPVDLKRMRMEELVYDGATIEEAVQATGYVAPKPEKPKPFKSRLKGEWKAP